ncbi:hypothetical protein V8C86DRAFT_3032794 [Haematococcus lacustris]
MCKRSSLKRSYRRSFKRMHGLKRKRRPCDLIWLSLVLVAAQSLQLVSALSLPSRLHPAPRLPRAAYNPPPPRPSQLLLLTWQKHKPKLELPEKPVEPHMPDVPEEAPKLDVPGRGAGSSRGKREQGGVDSDSDGQAVPRPQQAAAAGAGTAAGAGAGAANQEEQQAGDQDAAGVAGPSGVGGAQQHRPPAAAEAAGTGGPRKSRRLAANASQRQANPARAAVAHPRPSALGGMHKGYGDEHWYMFEANRIHTVFVCSFEDGEGYGRMYFVPANSLSRS